jgi:hypothetical protein
MLPALVVGLLVAVGTAASLAVGDVHGVMIVIVVGCAAAAAGAVAFANSVKKNVCEVAKREIVVTLRH